MSIINDALKKAQASLLKKNGSVETLPNTPEDQTPAKDATTLPAPAPVPSAPAAATDKKRWDTVILLEVLALCLIIGILFVFQPQIFRSLYRPKPIRSGHVSLHPSPQRPSPLSAAPSVITKTLETVPSSLSARPAAPKTALTEEPAAEPLVLNGIMLIEKDKTVALINDEIYHAGDSVQGKKITNITLEKVELSDGQETITLQVRPKRGTP